MKDFAEDEKKEEDAWAEQAFQGEGRSLMMERSLEKEKEKDDAKKKPPAEGEKEIYFASDAKKKPPAEGGSSGSRVRFAGLQRKPAAARKPPAEGGSSGSAKKRRPS